MAITRVATISDRASGRIALSAADGTARYARLRQDVVAAGILDRAYRYYAALVAAIITGMAVSGFFVLRLPVSVSLVLWAGAFAFFAVQVCGVVHDAGHRTIFKSTALNNAIGKASTGLLAMGFDSWRIRHNIHHAHTNEEDKDPDLDIPLHAFTVKQFQSQRGVFRYARRYQALIFVPMRVLVVFTRRLSEIEYFRSQPFGPRLVAQIFAWVLGLGIWFIAPFLLFPLVKAVIVLAVVHICMGFYLSNVFAPNHKGMPQVPRGSSISFLEQQIITSRNVRPSWITDIIYMGLNYQIEHHLFPSCPRNKLKHITPYVLEVCQETGIEYTQTGILESNRIVLGELNRIAKTASG